MTKISRKLSKERSNKRKNQKIDYDASKYLTKFQKRLIEKEKLDKLQKEYEERNKHEMIK